MSVGTGGLAELAGVEGSGDFSECRGELKLQEARPSLSDIIGSSLSVIGN